MRLKSLDTLRGIAVLLVLFSHSYLLDTDTPEIIRNIHLNLYHIGWSGVDLFFVLSGFLISGLIFNEINKTGDFSAKNFLIRRGFKIYPLFYTFIFITVVYKLFRHYDFLPLNLFAELFYFQNYTHGLWDHTWSLAVEEHFYFFIAIAFSLSIIKDLTGKRQLGKYILLFLLTILLARVITYFFIYDGWRIRLMSHLRIDGLMFGVLLSYIRMYHTEKMNHYLSKLKYILIPLSLIIVIASINVPFESAYIKTIGFTVMYICFGILLLYAYTNEAFFSKFKILPFIGYYSYAIYLFHMLIKFWGLNFVKLFIAPNSLVMFFIYLIGSVLIGVVFSKLIEFPFLKYRDKHFPSSQRKLVDAQALAKEKELGLISVPADKKR